MLDNLKVRFYYEDQHLYGQLCSLNKPCDSCPSPYRNECERVTVYVCFSCAVKASADGTDIRTEVAEYDMGGSDMRNNKCESKDCGNYL